MNAGDVDKACKSNGFYFLLARSKSSGELVSNTQITNPLHGDNLEKSRLIPDGLKFDLRLFY